MPFLVGKRDANSGSSPKSRFVSAAINGVEGDVRLGIEVDYPDTQLPSQFVSNGIGRELNHVIIVKESRRLDVLRW